MVSSAVGLAAWFKVPKMIIGATIVSLGTTFPEMVVSVLSAWQGKPAIALGNAIGSIICDTGLILGLATVIGPIPLHHSLVTRSVNLQFLSVGLLILVCLPFSGELNFWQRTGIMTQYEGAFFLILLGFYIFYQLHSGRKEKELETNTQVQKSSLKTIFILILCGIFLALASEGLILGASETARRLLVPESIIAVTIVALGTSLPELATALTAVSKNHGELALGNVLGADMLNVLLVAGAAAAFNPGGLVVEPSFLMNALPFLLAVIFCLRLGVFFSKASLGRIWGVCLLLIYLSMLVKNLLTILSS